MQELGTNDICELLKILIGLEMYRIFISAFRSRWF